jgi:hypothetical protein
VLSPATPSLTRSRKCPLFDIFPKAARPDAGKWFGFDLGYDKPTNASGQAYSAQQHNGNIAGQSWRSAGDNIARQYRYSYDAANRLLKADFIQNQGSWGKSFNYDSWMGDGNTAASAYDLNGNILRMQQKGWTPQNAGLLIDDLTYSYYDRIAEQTISNRLSNVNDAVPTISLGLGDFSNKNSTFYQYGYDNNGNVKYDLNRNIRTFQGIKYNHLNLPTEITVRTPLNAIKGKIIYLYNAGGGKTRKTVEEYNVSLTVNNVPYTNLTVTTTSFYAGGQVYESKLYNNSAVQTALGYTWQLQFFGHEEGRVRVVRPTPQSNPVALVYDYMLKDHLGNVRMPACLWQGAYGRANDRRLPTSDHGRCKCYERKPVLYTGKHLYPR